jgi:hypothetical protein
MVPPWPRPLNLSFDPRGIVLRPRTREAASLVLGLGGNGKEKRGRPSDRRCPRAKAAGAAPPEPRPVALLGIGVLALTIASYLQFSGR